MKSFEKEYYEAEEFWKEGVVEDPENLIRINTTIDLIPQNTGNLVDVGCGNGVFARILNIRRPEILSLSIDRSENALSFVKTLKLRSDITALPLANNTYDCVTCLEVLEHIPYPLYQDVLNELARISTNNIIISVPYNENLEKNVSTCPKCFSVFHSNHHLRKYNEENIYDLFKGLGFKCTFMKNIIKKETFCGIEKYAAFRELFKEEADNFNSPICPICGYRNPNFKTMYEGAHKKIAKPIKQSIIKNAIKKFWPKKIINGYWIIAFYERV